MHSSEEKALTPRIRFSGFTDAWEQRKLGDIGKARSGVGFPEAEQGGTAGIPFFKVSDMNRPGNELELKSSSNYVTGEQIARRGWKPIEDVPAMFFAKVGAAVMLNRKRLINEPFLLDNNTMAYSFDSTEWEVGFGVALFEIVNLSSLCQVGALPSYNTSDVERVKISVPSLSEQRAIGSLFRDLDDLIALHQRKCDGLKTVKKALLEKMFPRDGETAPEIRFASFTDAWEQRRLGDFGHVAMCKRIYKEQTSDYGDVPFFKIGTFGSEPDAFITDELYEQYRSLYPYPKPGTLLISAAGSIGRIVEYKGERAYYQDSNIVWLEHNDELDDSCLKQSLTNVTWTLEGSTIKRLYNKDIMGKQIAVPSVPEQRAIGALFSLLDGLIALHQRKLDALKNVKKSLLEGMFV